MTPSSPRRRSGFTLVELMIVCVILGILATIMIVRINSIRERAGRSAIMSDLRNLAVAQEGHFAAKNQYSLDPDSLQFRSSQGVTVAIVEATDKGWAARADRAGSAKPCGIYYGNAAPPTAASNQTGVIQCE